MPRKQAAAKPKAEDDGFGDIGDLLKAAVAETTHFPHYDPGGEAEVRKSEDGKTRTGVVDLNEDACYVSLLKCDRLVFEGKGATSIDSSPMTRIHIDMSNLANKAVLKQLERLTGLQHVYCYGDGTTLKLVEKMPKWIQPKLQRVGVIDLSHDRVDLAGLALEKVVVMGSSSEAPVLRSLCLDGNLLAELPEELGQCGSLHALYAHKNRLTEFPDWISELVGLKVKQRFPLLALYLHLFSFCLFSFHPENRMHLIAELPRVAAGNASVFCLYLACCCAHITHPSPTLC